MTKECENLRMEVDELRDQKESELETYRTRLEDEYRASLRLLTQEAQEVRER